jgi:hypothetical protein
MIGLPPNDDNTRLCAISVVGQVLAYVLPGPLLTEIWPELKMTPETGGTHCGSHRGLFTFVSPGLSLEAWNDHTGKETEGKQMTTPTVESAPEQAEQKKQTDPAGAKPAPAERASLPLARRKQRTKSAAAEG